MRVMSHDDLTDKLEQIIQNYQLLEHKVNHDIERKDGIINDLVQLTRLQNNEINNIRQEIFRLSTSSQKKQENDLRDEVEGLKLQLSSLKAQDGGASSSQMTTASPGLTRKAHVAIRDSQTMKDKIVAAVKEDMAAQGYELENGQGSIIQALKNRVDILESQMSSLMYGVDCLYTSIVPQSRRQEPAIEEFYDLQRDLPELTARLSVDAEILQSEEQKDSIRKQFSEISKTVSGQFSLLTKSESDYKTQKRQLDHVEKKQSDLEQHINGLSETVHVQVRVINQHDVSIQSQGKEIDEMWKDLTREHSLLKALEKAQSETENLKTRLVNLEHEVAGDCRKARIARPGSSSRSSSGSSTLYRKKNDGKSDSDVMMESIIELSKKVQSHGKIFRDLNDKVSAFGNRLGKHEKSLFSDTQDLINLHRRLNHAEKLIGALYPVGYFAIHGKSFYQDATSLRYIPTNKAAGETFSRLYGNRLEVIRFVDVAPPVVPLAFYAIARVRCSHEMWEGRLELKQEVRRVAERIVEEWAKTLPRHAGEEHAAWPEKEMLEDFNRLKLLCRRAHIKFTSETV